MSQKRDYWELPLIRSNAVADFLQALAPHLAHAQKHGLLLQFDEDGNLVALYPRAEGADPKPLHPILGECLIAIGRRAAELTSRPSQSRSSAGTLSLRDGIFAWVAGRLQPRISLAPQLEPESALLRVVLGDHVLEQKADLAAELMRRGRHGRIMTSVDHHSIIEVLDDPHAGATLEGFRAAHPEISFLCGEIFGPTQIWWPEHLDFDEEDRRSIAHLLNALGHAGLLARESDLYIQQALPEIKTLLHEPAAPESGADVAMQQPQEIIEPAQVSAASELGPSLRFELVELTASDEAQALLNVRINQKSFPLGYRIHLAPLPAIGREEEDIERLRAEIEEREANIALLLALGRQQIRLLRFSDAQLGAMVDGLRRMPRALRENGGLLYASGHAMGRAEPHHYLIYDPDVVQLDGVLPEAFWRARSEDSPMSFWLDPHAEDARERDPSAPHVFVPKDHRILPYIDSFGASLAGTLQLILGGLFSDLSALLENREAQPAFVFAPSEPAKGAEICVDVIDLKSFRPLRLSLRWINEHILARSPLVADPADRRELAETLYAGQLAQSLKANHRTLVEDLQTDWAEAEAELQASYSRLRESAAQEVTILHQEIEAARGAVALSQRRLHELERALAAVGQEFGRIDSGFDTLAAIVPAAPDRRLALLERFSLEEKANTAFMNELDAKIESLRGKAAALRDKWERR